MPGLADDNFSLCDTITFQLENDEVGDSDRHYSSGIKLACLRSTPGFVERRLRTLVPDNATSEQRTSFGLGQNIYTPDDLEEPELIEDDQPYAGWLYLDFGFETEVRSEAGDMRYLDMLGLQLGVVGKYSGAEFLQRGIHDLLNVSDPAGWDNQLDNEPGINLFYDRQWTGLLRQDFTFGGEETWFSTDLTPKAGAALGNIHIYGAAGLTLRAGRFADDDHGPPSIRPSFPGSDGLPKGNRFSAFVFGGVEGRAVGRNIFLDGNTFDDDSPSVDKNPFVGEARLGVSVAYRSVRVAYTHVFRSQEFDGQDPQVYGGVTLSFGL